MSQPADNAGSDAVELGIEKNASGRKQSAESSTESEGVDAGSSGPASIETANESGGVPQHVRIAVQDSQNNLQDVVDENHNTTKSKPLSSLLENAIDIPQTKLSTRRTSEHSVALDGLKRGCLHDAYRFLGPKADPSRSLVLHSEAQHHGEQSEASSHVKVGFNELFFDLVFVAVIVRLGVLYKADLDWDRTLEIVLLFVTYWLTWFHANMLCTRFLVRSIWYFFLFGVMLGTLLLSVFAVREDAVTKKTKSGLLKLNATVGMVCFIRFMFLSVYTFIACYNPAARPLIRKYMGFLLMSVLLTIVGVVVDDNTAIAYLWTASLVFEILMYPLSDLNNKKSLPINVEHNIERNGLWVVLILGESVISLSGSSHAHYSDWNYLATIALGFFIVFMMLNLYMQSQPEHECGMDTHACDIGVINSLIFNLSHLGITLGLFGMGIGLKFMVYYAAPDANDHGFDRNHAFLFTMGVSFALVWLNVARGSHRWAKYGNLSRTWIWFLHIVISLAIAPVGLFADPKGHGHGWSTVSVLGTVAVLVMLLHLLDSFLRPSAENWAVFEAFKMELERQKRKKKNLISGPAGFSHITAAPLGAEVAILKMIQAEKAHDIAKAGLIPHGYLETGPHSIPRTLYSRSSTARSKREGKGTNEEGVTASSSAQAVEAVEATLGISPSKSSESLSSKLSKRLKSTASTSGGNRSTNWLSETAVACEYDSSSQEPQASANVSDMSFSVPDDEPSQEGELTAFKSVRRQNPAYSTNEYGI